MRRHILLRRIKKLRHCADFLNGQFPLIFPDGGKIDKRNAHRLSQPIWRFAKRVQPVGEPFLIKKERHSDVPAPLAAERRHLLAELAYSIPLRGPQRRAAIAIDDCTGHIA